MHSSEGLGTRFAAEDKLVPKITPPPEREAEPGRCKPSDARRLACQVWHAYAHVIRNRPRYPHPWIAWLWGGLWARGYVGGPEGRKGRTVPRGIPKAGREVGLLARAVGGLGVVV